MTELSVFYDGGCPVCVAEIDHLKRLDVTGKIAFENICAADFTARFPRIDPQQADRILHGELADGEMIYGLDVTYWAWALVGKRRRVAVLRWPIFRQIAQLGYRFFARYRHQISRLVTGKKRCNTCASSEGAL
ncbi:MAG: DUF393 domain-containing protein [Porticoccaceae bacterium]|nr:DUF393 domain-containing protein [Porticoccaceae bacterium]